MVVSEPSIPSGGQQVSKTCGVCAASHRPGPLPPLCMPDTQAESEPWLVPAPVNLELLRAYGLEGVNLEQTLTLCVCLC